MGKKKSREMLFWTKDEFQTFIESMKDRPASYTVFMTMYYTGIREGELLALTPSDIDFEKKRVSLSIRALLEEESAGAENSVEE